MRLTSAIVSMAAALAVAAAVGGASADEGMFPMDGVGSWPVDAMRKAGLAIEPEALLELRKAVAKVAAGGSGSFVSDKGLLVTNHHVAYRCLAALDGTKEHAGIMKKGHVAADGRTEIPCPGYDLMVVEDVRDITAAVKAAAERKKGHRRFEAIRLEMEDLEARCQAEADGFYCDADSLDGGRFYHMMVYRLIKDVRLVYAPPEDLGKFGGDVDNWRYPRHTADFTFLRAYVGANGAGEEHSAANVPFKPLAHLTVSADGVGKGDQVLVMGFPARTKRNYPGASARFAGAIDMPIRKDIYDGLLGVLAKEFERDDLARRRYQGLEAGLNNATKYYDDVIKSFDQWKIIDKFGARDEAVDRGMVGRIDRIYASYEKVHAKFVMLQRLAWIVKSAGTAYDIVKWTQERVKPDRERKDEAYKDKNMYKTVGASDRLDEEITLGMEKALLGYVVGRAQQLPPASRIKAVADLLRWGKAEKRRLEKESKKAKKSFEEAYSELTGSTYDPKDPVRTTIDLLYARTRLVAHGDDRDEMERALFLRRRLFYNDVAEARRSGDPLLVFARNVAKELERIEKGPYRAVEETFDTELRPAYAEAVKATYPDANFQVRLSHGAVDDYTDSKDGVVHRYVTDLAGVLAKDTGADPFIVPEDLKAAAGKDKGRFIDAGLGDVPVNFTCTLDTTGGNSGSAVLDARGRLVGLLFDGTPESQLSDWQFLQAEQRSIVLDIRYALFLADKVHDAAFLLEEIGLGGGQAPSE